MIEIRKARNEELKGLIPIYKKGFAKHGIFSKPDKEILHYMEKAEGDFIIAISKTENKVLGGLLIVKNMPDTGHTLARFKHIVIAEEFQGQGIGKSLIKYSEREIGNGKIEIHVSDNEKYALEFYKHMGYRIEGELPDHYRLGETCFILGKTLKNDKKEV